MPSPSTPKLPAPVVLALPFVNTMPLSMPMLVPLILLKKPVMAGWPVSVTLLTVTPGPSNFCTNACALLDDMMFNCAFDFWYKKIQTTQSKNILQVGFTCPKLRYIF